MAAPISSSAQPRVLFVSHETTLSGAPMQLFHLVVWLQDQGWKPVVHVPASDAAESGPLADNLRARGVALVAEPLDHSFPELRRRFDLVFANSLVSWRAIEAAHAAGVPAIWYLHETRVAVDLVRQDPRIKAALDLASVILTPTRQTARIYEPLTKTPIEVLPYGIPQPADIPSGSTGESVTFLLVGTYEPRKGQDVFVEAIERLPRDTRRFAAFQIAGRALDREFYNSIVARAYPLPNVDLLGPLNHEQSLERIAAADVLVCSSRDETMPIVIIEALTLGKAVISTDVGGISEWIRDGLNGLLVPSEDAAALQQAIERCASDARLRERLGTTARRTFDRYFSVNQLGARFIGVVDRVLESHHAPGAIESKSYVHWVAQYDAITPAKRTAFSRAVRALHRQPLISILLPVFNPDLNFLREAIQSVTDQVYAPSELCIADDASTNPGVREFLNGISQTDPRIKVVFRETNGHISACSNSALSIATGEWCALLDQDDRFASHALATVAQEIEAHSNAALIYSDEDKIDLVGVRSNPFFKTDWDPELFLAQNYINHLGLYRTEILREIGGFREGYEGSQDYDLALRYIERVKASQIRHIPQILYHWRTVPGSLAAVPDAKPYAKEAARRAIADHLTRTGIRARVVPCPENVESHRVIYEIVEPSPSVSIIVTGPGQNWQTDRNTEVPPTFKSNEHVKRIRRLTSYPEFEVTVADPDSNSARARNAAAGSARGEIIAFLDGSIEPIEPNWLHEMVSHAIRAEVGAVGCRIWAENELLEHAGYLLGVAGSATDAFRSVPRRHAGYFNRLFLQRNCGAVSDGCMVVRKSVFSQVGGFDESPPNEQFSDVDLCLRIRRRGLEIRWTPYADVRAWGTIDRISQSAGDRRMDSIVWLQQRWATELLRDRFYNPNLSLHPPGYELAFPPLRVLV